MKLFKGMILFAIFHNQFACSTWRVVHEREYHELREENAAISVELVDGTRYETMNYIVHPDSIIIVGYKTLFYKGHRLAIPIKNILTVKKRVIDSRKSILLGLGTVVVLVTIFELGRATTHAASAGTR